MVDVEYCEAHPTGDPLVREPLECSRQVASIVHAGQWIALGLFTQLCVQHFELARPALQFGVSLGELAILSGEKFAVTPRLARL
ncbi:MAG: hypothetical protein ACXVSJ_00070 [Solirubrobacteraceae bacterium]